MGLSAWSDFSRRCVVPLPGELTISPLKTFLYAFLGKADETSKVVIANIRLPRVVAAIVCGWGLSLSGLCLQTLLRNPLSSPITLGINHGAAFGATAAIVLFGSGLVSVTAFAFAGGMTATLVILFLATFKRLSPAAIILAGVAMHSLFLSGIYLVQYIATETEPGSGRFLDLRGCGSFQLEGNRMADGCRVFDFHLSRTVPVGFERFFH